MICAPKILSVFLSDKIFTIPSVFEIALALEFAKKGKTPFVYSIPKYLNIYLFSLTITSVCPTAATSG
jgi:hypothetical protein